MTIIEQYILPGLKLLPEKMDSVNARAMLAATGLQESGFRDRVQKGGPARGFWQFEQHGGVIEILTSPSTRNIIEDVCQRIVLPPYTDLCYGAIAYHDALACCFARLLLWKHPDTLPSENEVERAWQQYLSLWRPGKPRPKDWPGNYKRAWEMVK